MTTSPQHTTSLDTALAPAPAAEGMRPGTWRGLGVGLLVGAAAFAAAYTAVEARRDALMAELALRQSLQATAKAEVLSTWADGMMRMGDTLTNADMLRLFATEAGTAIERNTMADDLLQQVPYMRALFDDFVRQNRLSQALLTTPQGRVFLASGQQIPTLTDVEKAAIARVAESLAPEILPPVSTDKGLMVDVMKPVLLLDDSPKAVAVLVMNVPLADLSRVLAPSPLSLPGETTRYLIADAKALLERRADGSLGVAPARSVPTETRFDERPSVAMDATSVFSAVSDVPALPWLRVVSEASPQAALAEYMSFRNGAYGVAVLMWLASTALLLALFWRLQEGKVRALADQYRALARQINAQRRLLDSINQAIYEHISLKRPDGSYAYVNPAFARFWGKNTGDILNRDDLTVFGAETAALLKEGDATALQNGLFEQEEREVIVGGQPKVLHVQKVPVPGDEPGSVAGLVSVARDMTDIVAARRKVERVTQQSIAALVRTVEIRDPHLAGHHARVTRLAQAIANVLDLPDDDHTTLRFAAQLAGIGKVFVPLDVLTKPGRLTPEETKVMHSHVTHAMRVLEPIDFGLPVAEVISQMYERADGSGYPFGKKNDGIHPLARLLAVCDVFCALISPRAYRDAKSFEDALALLRKDSTKFDPKVISALDEVLAPEHSSRLRADLTATPAA